MFPVFQAVVSSEESMLDQVPGLGKLLFTIEAGSTVEAHCLILNGS